MEEIPQAEACSFSFGQEVPHVLWNPKVNYCFHNSPPPDPIMSQLNPVHNLIYFFFNIQFNLKHLDQALQLRYCILSRV
jgi:hypothetical protein